MRKYLDPHLYMYDSPDWGNSSFIPRLRSLMALLEYVQMFERERDVIGRVFTFRTSREIRAKVWEYNPFRNEPDSQPFFKQMYMNKIWPDLMRRLVECPFEEQCLDDNENSSVVPDPADPLNNIDILFTRALAVCGDCGSRARQFLFFHADKKGVADVAPYFSAWKDLKGLKGAETMNAAMSAVSTAELWPDINNVKARDAQLMAAAEAMRLEVSARDSEWARCSLASARFSEKFWRTLHRAKFGAHSALYKDRIIYTVLQLLSRRDVDINEHEIVHEEIKIAEICHRKWTAYVFKMGVRDDRRCSRIHYTKLNEAFYIDEYIADAH